MGSATPANSKSALLHLFSRFLLILRWAKGLQTQHAFRHHVALNLI